MSNKYGVLIKFFNDEDELHGIYNSFEEAKKAINGFLKFTAKKYNYPDVDLFNSYIQNGANELNFVEIDPSFEIDKDFPVKFKVINVVSGRFMDKNKSNKSKDMEFEKKYKNEYEKPVKGTYDSSVVDISRAFEQEEQERTKNEYEKPVTGTYDSATSADFRTPRMKNEQATYDLNKSVKKLAEEEDKYLEERWDEAHEDFIHLRRSTAKKKPTPTESRVPHPIVTFGLKGDDIYVGLTDPKGDTMWMKLDTVLNFNNNC